MVSTSAIRQSGNRWIVLAGGVGHVGGELQAAGFGIAQDDLLQARLVDGHAALLQAGDRRVFRSQAHDQVRQGLRLNAHHSQGCGIFDGDLRSYANEGQVESLTFKMTAYTLSSDGRDRLDTNVFASALRSEGGAAREVLRRVLLGRYRALFGNALWMEYQDLL